MPYNVICLSCTVVALAFGPLYNITTKQLVLRTTDSRKGLLLHLKDKLFCKKRKTEVNEQENNEQHNE